MPIEVPFTLSLYCEVCGGAVSLQMSHTTVEQPRDVQYWKCPYCEKPQSGRFPYKLVWVTKGHSGSEAAN